MQILNIPLEKENGYYIKAAEGTCDYHMLVTWQLSLSIDPTYFPGRCADVYVNRNAIGKVGVVHPDVVRAFDLHMPVSALEINIEVFI